MGDWRYEIQCEVDRLTKGISRELRVLDAGGGKKTPLAIKGEFHLTVVDMDPASIAINPVAHERIVADIETHDYGDQLFDLVICWDVLEHLKTPGKAIRRLSAAVAPGGLLIIKGPVPSSLKAIITRMTPHWFHVAFHRYVLGSRNAGRPGYAPYPVHLSADADEVSLTDYLRTEGLDLVATGRFEGSHAATLKRKLYPAYLAYRAASRIVRLMTGGRAGGIETDFYLVAAMPRDSSRSGYAPPVEADLRRSAQGAALA